MICHALIHELDGKPLVLQTGITAREEVLLLLSPASTNRLTRAQLRDAARQEPVTLNAAITKMLAAKGIADRRRWRACSDAEWAACADTGNYSEIYATLSGSRETCSTRLVGQLRESHATRSLATDLELALRLTVISMSRPSTSKSRIKRSIEKPDSLPCLSAETLG